MCGFNKTKRLRAKLIYFYIYKSSDRYPQHSHSQWNNVTTQQQFVRGNGDNKFMIIFQSDVCYKLGAEFLHLSTINA